MGAKARRKGRQKEVHFVFKSHPGGELLLRDGLRKGTRSVLLEHPTGVFPEKDLIKLFRKRISEKEAITRWNTSMKWLLENVEKRGIKIKVGETVKNADELNRLRELFIRNEFYLIRFVEGPSLRRFATFAICAAKYHRFRHSLIKRTIRETIEKGEAPVTAIYGTAHRSLSRDLLEEGIKSSREIRGQVFTHAEEIIERLIMGERPKKIPKELWRKGFISAFLTGCTKFPGRVTGKHIDKLTDRDAIFFSALERALIDNLLSLIHI